MIIDILNAIIAIVLGVAGAVALFWLLDWLVSRLPKATAEKVRPFVYVGPALLLVTVYLIYPTLRTIYISFFDRLSVDFVGLDNYADLATDDSLLEVLFNNVLWIIVVPLATVAIGLAVAVLADRLPSRVEALSKSVIFMPMAISMVGASTIWSFVYAFTAADGEIGLLNGIWVLFGGEETAWLQKSTLNLNDFLLMVILIWMQAGFSMVLLSAAIKNVPEETLEAARIDGASEWQAFRRVIVPQIRSTIVVILTTVTILTLKIFDIVYVTTRGAFGTDIVPNRFITELLQNRNFGLAAVLVVLIIVATIPIMVINVRRLREEEGIR
ncbi:MAG: carbohydrate ABC transporter permease [Acidimicrobiales bacterium]